MAILPTHAEPFPALEQSYLTGEWTIKSWLLTRDHKRIALMFFASITFFFFIGGAAATLIRMQLATPDGGLLEARCLQSDVHDAWRCDGLVLSDPVDPDDAR